MSEAQIDPTIAHAELRVPPPNEAEAAAFAKYHGTFRPTIQKITISYKYSRALWYFRTPNLLF